MIAAANRAAWDAALAAFVAAEAAYVAHPYGSTNEDETGFRALERTRNEAYDLLLETPAPDLPAIEARHLATRRVTALFEDVPDAADLIRADERDLRAILAARPPEPSTAEWDAALADYTAKRALSDAMPLGTEGEDEAIDVYCEAMDLLVERTRAPSLGAVLYKLDLIEDRWQDFSTPDAVFDALRADLRCLGWQEPVLGAVVPSVDRTIWEARLADFERLFAALNAHPYGKAFPDHPDAKALEADQQRVMEREIAAERAFFLTPAPDAAAFRVKVDWYRRAELLSGGADEGPYFDSIVADALRLISPASGGDDSALLAHFAEYARALKAFEEGGDAEDETDPLTIAWNNSRDAIDASPPPTTVAGTIALLRFGLAVNNTAADEQAMLLWGTREDRDRYGRENWETLDIETRPMWGALLALEAMEGGR